MRVNSPRPARQGTVEDHGAERDNARTSFPGIVHSCRGHPVPPRFIRTVGWALCGLWWGLAAAQSDLELREIAPGIFVHQGRHELPDTHNRGEIANIGFIVGERCVAVIDSGGSPEQGRALKAAIAVHTPLPVCYVINTHVHPDHIYGNRAFKAPGVSFIGHHKLAQAMALRAPYYIDKAARDLGYTLTAEDFVPPDQPVEESMELDLGNRTLRLTAHGPAHTDNDLSVYDAKTATLWAADLLFMGHLPVVDGSLTGWLKEIDRLKAVPARLAIPGHGPAVADWPQAAAAEERYLNGLATEVRAAIRQHRTMEQAMETVGTSMRDEWRLFDEFNKRNVSTAFAALEWEDD
ncbi:quinoprotein relay system zinc metallohydrolase 2 [Methylococcus capsulatus]|uniref:quinoprotein relay system zinc metallohydrolase 2 n=1 Tax=Methylococcus capsulatus TaxID=414 RepID=UPI001C527BB1|nr:quinoprotein relay system zinc metallohydrolase 2 [Methylococcus capsulatus]QXP88867.1 quinoprotein relay system zinc metallohydrolase 2 [Methylococcus capsulatus]QXP94099.1 quinoprotein relay system zinc metallohydrolase 2 [Methylococcus capsulatus]UQN11162.1 quinoprotein relay system zinc metallohydrolase 2 [Methylococcus capsulatus]